MQAIHQMSCEKARVDLLARPATDPIRDYEETATAFGGVFALSVHLLLMGDDDSFVQEVAKLLYTGY